MNQENLNERIGKLSPAKRALLEQRLRERSGLLDWRIPRRQTEAPVRLSFGQERLWFLHQLEPESPAYNEGRAFSVKGKLDIIALESAFRRIIRRHDVLRTRFIPQDGIPLQVISEDQVFTLSLIDLRSLPESERQKNASEHIRETLNAPFDLSRDLLLRGRLIRVADEEHILTLVTHHIASDGWSAGILVQELQAFYDAASNDRPADLPIQYADYSDRKSVV